MELEKSTSGFGEQQVGKDNSTGGSRKMQQVDKVMQQVKRILDQIEC